MASLVVMYKTPTDTAAFDKHYFESTSRSPRRSRA